MTYIPSKKLTLSFLLVTLVLGGCTTTRQHEIPDFDDIKDENQLTKLSVAYASTLKREGVTNIHRVANHMANNNLAVLCNSVAEDKFFDETGSRVKIHSASPEQETGAITTYHMQGRDGAVVPMRYVPSNNNNPELEELEEKWHAAVDTRLSNHINFTSRLTSIYASDLEHTFQNILQCAAALNNEFQSEEETTKLYNAVTRVMSRAKAMGAKIPTDEQLEAFLPGISEHIRKHPPLVMREEEAPELIKQ